MVKTSLMIMILKREVTQNCAVLTCDFLHRILEDTIDELRASF